MFAPIVPQRNSYFLLETLTLLKKYFTVCGIVGFIDENRVLKNDDLGGLLDCLVRRGPDNQSYRTHQGEYGTTYLGHARLKIIDLSDKANQPISSDTSEHHIIFNGEIYNYKALQQKCIASGAKFQTDSDTEVVLKTFEIFGIEETLELLDGMFAFAIFNSKTGKIIIARDRFGQKPLYYGTQNGVFAFSSDIRSFAQLFPKLTIDKNALGYLFSELSTPREHSIWNEVKKLKAGHYIIKDDSDLSIKKYWNPQFSSTHKKSEIDFDTVDSLITAGVKKRLVADVSVGTFLSGGVDSSLITALAARESEKKISTFSVGFNYEKYNELPFAKIVADKYNTDHHELNVNPSDFDAVDELINEFGEPFADSSMIPTAFVSKFAKTKVTVALGGDGGDEFFCGYPTYNEALLMQNRFKKLKSLKTVAKLGGKMTKNARVKNVSELLNEPSINKSKALFRNMGFNNNQLNSLFSDEEISSSFVSNSLEIIKESEINTDSMFNSIWYSTLHTRLVNDYLVKVDKASMFHSLEVRSPLLDKELFKHVIQYSPEQLLQGQTNKYILKKIAEKYVPKEVLYRKKMGFAIPIGEWFRKELKNQFTDIVLNSKQDIIEIDYTFIENLFNSHLNGEDHSHKLWTLYVFHKWLNNWENNFELKTYFNKD